MGEQEKVADLKHARCVYKMLIRSHVDSKGIMKILCERTAEERIRLAYCFEKEYNLRLCDVLQYRMPEELKVIAFGLSCDHITCCVSAIFNCVGGRTLLNEKRLLSILVASSNWQLQEIQREYETFYGQPLKLELKRHGLMDEYVIAKIMKAERLESSNIDLIGNVNTKELARKIKTETNNRNIIDVMCTQNWEVVKKLFKDGAFSNVSSTSRVSLYTLRCILEYADDPIAFWARRLDDLYIACIVAMSNTMEREEIYQKLLQIQKFAALKIPSRIINDLFPLMFKGKERRPQWFESIKRKLSNN